jgi:ABC-type transport system involved in multi-copper enzyme maturation permease subunit
VTGTLARLTSNELLKITRRRLVWALLVANLVFVFAAWLVQVYYALRSPDGFQAGHLLGGTQGIFDAIGQPMTLGRRSGEFIAAALGGLFVGGEFTTGAIRLTLSRGVNRLSYVLAKLAALTLTCIGLVLAGILMSAVLSLFLPLISPLAPTWADLTPRVLGELGGLYLGTLANYLLCLLLGAGLALLARSAAFGIAASFAWLIGGDIAAQILPVVGASVHSPIGHDLVRWMFTPNVNALYARSLPPHLRTTLDRLDGVIACNPMGAHSCTDVGLAQALPVAALWMLVLGLAGVLLFARRDVKE